MPLTTSTIAIAGTAAGAERLGWDELRDPDDFFLSTRWLRVLAATVDVPLRYLVAARGDTGQAGLATALLDQSAPWLLGRPDTLLEHSLRQRWAGAANCAARLAGPPAGLLPSLVCGGRHLGRTRAVYRPDTTTAELAGLVAAAEDLARAGGARSVAFPYVDARDSRLREVLAGRGYLSHGSGSYSWLPVPAGGLPAWLGTVSAHRQRRIRAERRRLAAAGIEVRIEPLTAAAIPRLATLEAALFGKYGIPGWSAARSEAVLWQVLDALGPDAQLSVARGDGQVRGFGLLLRDRDQWHAHRAGFDYPYQRRHRLPVYFEVIYYHPVAAAPAEGIRTIHYGIGSEAVKRSRGCAASDQYAYLLPLGERP
jgi:hypothetical protein